MPQTNHIPRSHAFSLGLTLALVFCCATFALAYPVQSFAVEARQAGTLRAASEAGLSAQAEFTAQVTAADFLNQDHAGTEQDPYLINTPDDLFAFAKSVDEGNTYKGQYVALQSDIDLSGYAWVWNPIGGEAAVSIKGETTTRNDCFAGTFRGRLKSIKGLKFGSSEQRETASYNYVGLFAALAPTARVEAVVLEDVSIHVKSKQGIAVGGIAAYMDSQPDSGSGAAKGAVVDCCYVSGSIGAAADSGYNMQLSVDVGGIVGRQIAGAVVNCASDVDVDASVEKGTCEAGGLVASCRSALVANSYSTGDIRAISNFTTANGPATPTAGLLVGMLTGSLVNCYATGSLVVSESDMYSGAVFGRLSGDGLAYNCFYNAEATKTVSSDDPVAVVPWGTQDVFNQSGNINAFNAEAEGQKGYQRIADSLDASFDSFPVDVSTFELGSAPFRPWICSNANNRNAVLGGRLGIAALDIESAGRVANYVPLDIEVVENLHDGIWHGRSDDGSYQVDITVKSETIAHIDGGDNYSSRTLFDQALSRAREKSAYGDVSGYGLPSTDGKFAGGSGTSADPYLVSNEVQLRAIAEAVNEDNDWSGVYFRQIDDIVIDPSTPWLPIGWGIMAKKAGGTMSLVCEYPFAGVYDGGGCEIRGLSLSADEGAAASGDVSDSALWTRSYAAGLFGVVRGGTVINVNVVDAAIDIASAHAASAGVLVGLAADGFLIENCSASGTVSLKAASNEDGWTAGALCAGGLVGLSEQGSIIDSNADVDVRCDAGRSDAFAGGLIGLDDEVMSVGCSAEGNVTGGSNKENKAHVGGLTGQTSGIQYNCYATGNVAATSKTADAGLLNGALTGSAVERRCYYNEDAALTVAGASVSPKQAEGTTNGIAAEAIAAEPRAESDFDTSAFQATLAQNQADLAQELDAIAALLGSSVDESALRYYTALDLAHAVVKFATPKIAYSGHAWAPEPVVTLSGKALVRGQDYEVTAYRDNVNAGIARVTVTGTGVYHGTATGYFTIEKAPSKLSSKVLKKTLKAKAGKTAKFKAKKTFRITANTSGGKVTYKLTKVPKKAKKKIKVSKAGKVTVKKGLARGTYKIKVRITSAETANYQSASKTVALKIRVR